MRAELELRNLPHHRLMEYLVEAGGEVVGVFSVRGDGWTAYLKCMDPVQVGTIRVPCDFLVIEGDSEAVERVYAFMRRKTMRGGG